MLTVTVAAASATEAEVLAKTLFLAGDSERALDEADAAGDPHRSRDDDGDVRARGSTPMKTDPTFWILARAQCGLLAYCAPDDRPSSPGSCSRLARSARALKAAAVTDLHRFLALLGLGFICMHAAALVLDSTVHISVAASSCPGLVPTGRSGPHSGSRRRAHGRSSTPRSQFRRRIGARAWRRLHWFTYAVFALATVHGLAAGTDSGRHVGARPLRRSGRRGRSAPPAGEHSFPSTKGGDVRVPDRDRPLAV